MHFQPTHIFNACHLTVTSHSKMKNSDCGFESGTKDAPCLSCYACAFTGNQEASYLSDNAGVSDAKDDGPSDADFSDTEGSDVYASDTKDDGPSSTEDETDVYVSYADVSGTKDEGSSSKTGYGAFNSTFNPYIPETDVSDADIPSDTNSDPESEQDAILLSRRRKKRPRGTRIVSTLHPRKRPHFHQIALDIINSV